MDSTLRTAVASGMSAVIGGDPASLDGARASWSLLSAASSGLSRSFRVSGGAGTELVAVGDLEFRVVEPAAKK